VTLPRVRLGRTGLEVSRLGLGLAAVGRPGYVNLGRADDLPGARTPADLYARTAALLDAARTPSSMDDELELHVVRHTANAPRLDLVVPREGERAPWRELPP
jgi:hypothetical protein